MIFKRRERPSLWSRFREMMYPRKGIWRGMDYIRKRLHRLPDSPHRIALGFACGAAASFTPLFGFHIIIAAAVAWLIGGNLLAAAFGTVVGNPVTFPFIAAMALEIGWGALGDQLVTPAEGLSASWGLDNADLIFWPYLVGGVGPGIVCGAVCYWLIGPVVAAYQERRRRRLAERARRTREAALREQQAYAAGGDGKEGDNA